VERETRSKKVQHAAQSSGESVSATSLVGSLCITASSHDRGAIKDRRSRDEGLQGPPNPNERRNRRKSKVLSNSKHNEKESIHEHLQYARRRCATGMKKKTKQKKNLSEMEMLSFIYTKRQLGKIIFSSSKTTDKQKTERGRM
jgi:hypothetical protein